MLVLAPAIVEAVSADSVVAVLTAPGFFDAAAVVLSVDSKMKYLLRVDLSESYDLSARR